jgi:hypothetical protein
MLTDRMCFGEEIKRTREVDVQIRIWLKENALFNCIQIEGAFKKGSRERVK